MTLFWQSFQSSSRESIEHFLASVVMVRVTVLVLDSAVLPHPLTALQHCQAAGCTSTHAPLPVSRRRQIYEPNTLEITRGALPPAAAEPECVLAQL